MPKRVHGQQPTAAPRYTRTMGIDTDSRYLVTAFYDADHPQDLKIIEFPQNQTGVYALIESAKVFAPELIVIESTANYHILAYDALARAGLPIVVINPITVKALLRVEGKSDKGDAVTLARIGAGFALSASNMPNALQRELGLAFSRYDSMQAEKIRVSMRLSAQLLSCSFTLPRVMSPSSKTYQVLILGLMEGLSREELAELASNRISKGKTLEAIPGEIPQYLRDHVKEIWPYLSNMMVKQAESKKTILSYLTRPEIKAIYPFLMTVPAMSEFLMLRLVAEMGENFWQGYPTAAAFARSVGVVPSNEISGGKLLKKKSTHGNIRLKMHLLMSVKAFVIHPNPSHPAYDWFISYKARANYMKAVSGLARQVIEGCYHVCRLSEPYKYKGRFVQFKNQ